MVIPLKQNFTTVQLLKNFQYNKRDMNTLNFYLTQLSVKRAEPYSKSWYTTGCVIHNCSNGSKEGLEIWHRFSQRHEKYNKDLCDKKWDYFKKQVKFYAIRLLVPMIYEDGGTTYNPSKSQIVPDEDVRNLVYNTIIPKLSIRRMRNNTALNNLCSAIYTMSEGKDEHILAEICKRIKDRELRNIFTSTWKHKRFRFSCDINSIISWHNSDEKEKPNPRATNIKPYVNNDPLWLERTTNYLKSFDNAGCTPRYFKVSKEERKKLKPKVAKRKLFNELCNDGCFELVDTLIAKGKL